MLFIVVVYSMIVLFIAVVYSMVVLFVVVVYSMVVLFIAVVYSMVVLFIVVVYSMVVLITVVFSITRIISALPVKYTCIYLVNLVSFLSLVKPCHVCKKLYMLNALISIAWLLSSLMR